MDVLWFIIERMFILVRHIKMWETARGKLTVKELLNASDLSSSSYKASLGSLLCASLFLFHRCRCSVSPVNSPLLWRAECCTKIKSLCSASAHQNSKVQLENMDLEICV